MSKVVEKYEQLAMALGFHFDKVHNVIYGTRGGYQMILHAENTNYPYMLTISVAAKSSMGVELSKEDIKQFRKENSNAAVKVGDNVVKMTNSSIKNQSKLQEKTDAFINSLVNFLQIKGYVPCCQSCGLQADTTSYMVGNSMMHLCPECYNRIKDNTILAEQAKEQKKENVVGGIVGALIGSVIGVICILFFSQLGKVAVISGFVMAVCTIKGYEMLSGKLTRKGIIISCIMMLVMTYIGDRLDWAIMIVREVGTEWGIDFATAYQAVPQMLAEDMIDSGSYWGNLALLYLFTVAGAVPTISSMIKERKNEGKVEQIV